VALTDFAAGSSVDKQKSGGMVMERKAHCGCGNVTVTVSGDPQTSFACHCDACQKATGSIANFGVVFREEDFISIEGETTVYGDFPKWPGAEKYFCSKCGTTVHWVNPAAFPGMRLVSLGCFADPSFPAPEVEVQTQYRHLWCKDFVGAQTYEAFPS
jgi:hypothetical protein